MKEKEVREYYSNIFDLLRVHRRRFFLERGIYQIRKEITLDEINREVYIEDVNVCTEKINTNKTCNFYLTKLFSKCSENNYDKVYTLGNNIINMYDQNIKYLDSKILEGNYLKRGIAYTSNMDYEENFTEYVKKEYQKIKIYK